MNPFGSRGVTTSHDFLRILRLPTRTPREVGELVREMTEALRTSSGAMTLRGVQALALYELMCEDGLFGPMGVGTGKTLVTLLAAVVTNAQRPLLLLPAALVQKTIHERAELMAEWKVSTATRLYSYQMLGRESAAEELERYQPDLIVADEVHRLKNKKAAVTRRVARYMADHPDTKFVALSGTVIKNSLRDFAHILRWCLGAEHAPVPQKDGELEEWADALDEKVQPLKRVKPGVLVQFDPQPSKEKNKSELEALSDALRRKGSTRVLQSHQTEVLSRMLRGSNNLCCHLPEEQEALSLFLVPIVTNAQRPLLLLPSSDIEGFVQTRSELMADWNVSTATRLYSYQMLGRESAGEELERLQPDLIILSKVDRLKEGSDAWTRLNRYLKAHSTTRIVAVSREFLQENTLTHIRTVCGGDVYPAPEDNELARARKAFRRRLVDTPGVVASLNAEAVDCSLIIEGKVYDVNAATEDNFQRLRTAWETPDGWTLSEAMEVWRHAKQLALGLHYEWSPRPPEEWLAKRRAWAKFVREELSGSHTLDTEKQVRTAVEKGELHDGGILAEWKETEPTFTVNSRPVWHDETALDICAAWLKREKGIVWTEHTFFAQELSRRTGVPYFGQNGRDQKGREIDKDESVTGPVIASIHSCATGKNLQYKWSKNLITSCPSGGDLLEQLIGRTHRPGQPADEVEVEILVGCIEHLSAWESALAESKMSADMMGQTFKVTFADKTMPQRHELECLPGMRWRKVKQKKGDD